MTSRGKLKTMTTAEKSSKSTGRPSPVTTTSPPSTGRTSQQLILYVEDFHVNPSVVPGSEQARQMTVISGRKWSAVSTFSGPLGSLVKMCLDSSIWGSSTCSLTWKPLVIKHQCLGFRLVASMPRTFGNGSGLWRTPTVEDSQDREFARNNRGEPKLSAQAKYGKGAMWPTPVANDDNKTPRAHMAMKARMKGGPRYTITSLQVAAKMWPTPHGFSQDDKSHGPSGNELGNAVNRSMWATPNSTDWKNRGTAEYREEGNRQVQLQTQVGGSLNPTWVEWLQGFPQGWTEVD